MSAEGDREAWMRRHLHRVTGPVHYRREAEAMLARGASPQAVTDYLSSTCPPPTMSSGWVVIAGEGLWWIWGERLTRAARHGMAGEYAPSSADR